MKIQTSKILPNPHRDLNMNPIRAEQVEKLKESISRTGFWDNVVVRECPEKRGLYQLAYGHNRLAAVIELGIKDVDIPVRELTDWDMYVCMVDENNTQATVTPQIVYENISVGAKLLEKYITSASTADEFLSLVSGKNSSRPAPDVIPNNRFSEIKNRVEAGEGVGKDLIQQFVPNAAGNSVVSTVLENIYGEARRKAAEAKAEQARKERDAQLAKEKADREAAAVAEAKRKQAEHEASVARERASAEQRNKAEAERIAAEARAAERRAKEAEAERQAAAKRAERAAKAAKEAADSLSINEREAAKLSEDNLVDKDILLAFGSPSVMSEFVLQVKKCGIPKKLHKDLAYKVITEGWSQKGMRQEIAIWWDKESGEAGRRYARVAAENKRKADLKKYNNGDLPGYIMQQNDKVRDAMRNLDVVLQYLEHANPVLQKNTVELYATAASKLIDVVKKYESLHAEKAVNPQSKMLSHR